MISRILILVVSVCIANASFAAESAEKRGWVPLGTIITSILNFNDFSKETKNFSPNYNPQKSKWAPADGRNVAGSAFEKRYKQAVPDLRGQFLRGLNQFYSPDEPSAFANGKDQGKRSTSNGYSYQESATKLPSNSFTGNTAAGGSHTHSYTAVIPMGSAQNIPNANGPQVNSGTATTGGGGSHIHTTITNGGGDKETRPINTAVYYYIRIND